jgi:hypothetical protein
MIIGAGELLVAQTDLSREAITFPALTLFHNLFFDCYRVPFSSTQACSSEQYISILEHTSTS